MPGARGGVIHDGAMVAGAASATLQQCAALLRSMAEATYTMPSRALGGGTIGQHVRHSLDHFAAALLSAPDGHIDYDTRERGTSIEVEPKAAVDLISTLVRRLDTLTETELAGAVTVHVMLSGDGRRAALSSTLERELWFASHHAIHHHAMIDAMAREFGLPMPQGFGKAPSTIDHERRTTPSGR